MKNKPLILASSSRYRQELLKRLGLPFTAISPDIDETPCSGEPPDQTASRLAGEKAQALVGKYPHALIIGSDQVAVLNDQRLGKPGDHGNAVKQLRVASGNTIYFYTALCVLDSGTGLSQHSIAVNEVKFRRLSDDQIERYLVTEQPYDCAGSAKSEGLGIALIEHIRGDDPNALIGLPLIQLVTALQAMGVAII